MGGMARPIRIEYEGAIYHVTARGNRRGIIYDGNKDRLMFLGALGEMVERFGVRVFAYCLMSNHYHLAVGTPRGNLSRAMGWLQTTYTVRYNLRRQKSGHLFQGRYKAILVDEDEYAMRLVEYIHLNPARIGLKRGDLVLRERQVHLNEYRWSSHRYYGGFEKTKVQWLDESWTGYYGRNRKSAVVGYLKAMSGYFGREHWNLWDETWKGLVLGGEELRRCVSAKMEGMEGIDERILKREISQERLSEKIKGLIKNESMKEVRMWLRIKVGGERAVDVGKAEGYQDGRGAGMAIRRLEQKALLDKGLQKRMEQLKRKLLHVES